MLLNSQIHHFWKVGLFLGIVHTAFSSVCVNEPLTRNSELSNWDQTLGVGGSISFSPNSDGVKLVRGSSGITRLVYKKLFTGPGRYELNFDLLCQIEDNSNIIDLTIRMPGGIGVSPCNNNATVVWSNFIQNVLTTFSSNWKWAHYQIIQENGNVSIKCDNEIKWSGNNCNLDYAGFCDLSFEMKNHSTSTCTIKNVVLDFTPITPIWRPSPINGALHVTRYSPILQWAENPLAISYNIYFGTNSSTLSYLGNTIQVSYKILPLLDVNKDYYWRIDPVINSSQTLTGNIFQFKTIENQIGLCTSKNGELVRNEGKYSNVVGANYFNAFDDADTPNTLLNPRMAALADYNVPFIRLWTNEFTLSNTSDYINANSLFWQKIDAIVHAAEKNNLGLIMSLFWNHGSYNNFFNEESSAYSDPWSQSSRQIKKYIKEIMDRYIDSSSIWGWELGNEWNTDLPEDIVNACAKMFSVEIRKYDPNRMISNGNNDWRNPGMCRCFIDSPTCSVNFNRFNAERASLIDVKSTHNYRNEIGEIPDELSGYGYLGLSKYFRTPLFVGEFGSYNPPSEDLLKNRDDLFFSLGILQNSNVPLSAVWGYERPTSPLDFSRISADNSHGRIILNNLRDCNILNPLVNNRIVWQGGVNKLSFDSWNGPSNSFLDNGRWVNSINPQNSGLSMNSVTNITASQGLITYDFDMQYSLQWNNDGRMKIIFPGGLQIALNACNNGGYIYFKNQKLIELKEIAPEYCNDWNHYSVILLGRQATIKRNGNIIYSDLLPSDPDYLIYPQMTASSLADAPGTYLALRAVKAEITPGFEFPIQCGTLAKLSFSDDFESQSLCNWQIDNNFINYLSFQMENNSRYLHILQGGNTINVKSNMSFYQPGFYIASFDMRYDLRWNNDGRLFVRLPGGLRIGLESYNNGTMIYFTNSLIGNLSGGNYQQWAHYEIGYNSKSCYIKRNEEVIFCGKIGSDLDFINYPKIEINAGGDDPINSYVDIDNFQLKREPLFKFIDRFDQLSSWDSGKQDTGRYDLRWWKRDINTDWHNSYIISFDDDHGKCLHINNSNTPSLLYLSNVSIDNNTISTSFDLKYDVQWNNDGRVKVFIPGGLGIGLKGWNNGTIIYYKDREIAQVAGGHWNQWANYELIQQNRHIIINRNGILIYEGIVDSDPDFINYNKVSCITIPDIPNAFMEIDNVTIE